MPRSERPRLGQEGLASGPVDHWRAPPVRSLIAAQLAADQLRKETDKRVEQIVQAAARRTDEILADGQRQVSALLESKPSVPPAENRVPW
ncbi:MAG TPA: hypothetical protein VGA42_10470 [Gemmatimonadales bacterium]